MLDEIKEGFEVGKEIWEGFFPPDKNRGSEQWLSMNDSQKHSVANEAIETAKKMSNNATEFRANLGTLMQPYISTTWNDFYHNPKNLWFWQKFVAVEKAGNFGSQKGQNNSDNNTTNNKLNGLGNYLQGNTLYIFVVGVVVVVGVIIWKLIKK